MRKRKSIAIALIAAMTIGIAGCSERGNTSKEEPTSTHARLGEGRIMGQWSGIYTFREAVETADLIVDVTIIEWLGESTESERDRIGRDTYFLAKVNQVIKGEAPDTIVVVQHGDSSATNVYDALYGIDNRLFLFLYEMPYDYLKKAIEEGKDAEAYDVEYENAYESVGMFQTSFNIQRYRGETYLLSRYNHGIVTTMTTDVDLKTREAIVNELIKEDPFIGEWLKEDSEGVFGYAFSYDKIVERINKMLEEKTP